MATSGDYDVQDACLDFRGQGDHSEHLTELSRHFTLLT
jgi:hypothetical protein